MTTEDRLPVTEDELHAYVDGELPEDRREAVSNWLATHADAAEQIAVWRAQSEAIQARFGAIALEPVPERLKIDNVLRRDRSWSGMAAAAAVAAFLIGGGVGWFAHGATASTPSPFERLAGEALQAHKLYTLEVRHPVEVGGDERPHMTQWLSRRVGYELPIPELESIGLKLVGGRLLPGPGGVPAAFYMYEGPSGERFTIYCSKTNAPDTALRYKDSDRAASIFWVDDKRGYVVSGPADRERMERITQAIYEQVDRPSPNRNRS
jgi:anti-sigma factor RsiW